MLTRSCQKKKELCYMMHIARRLITIIQTEGLSGVMQRIHCRIAKFRLRVSGFTNRPQVKSVYGFNLKANYDDRTFSFYVTGAYGFFYSSLLHAIDRKFNFIDIGANQG